MGSWVSVWARCGGWLGAVHITIVVKRTGFRSAAFVAECHKPCTATTCLLPRSLCATRVFNFKFTSSFSKRGLLVVGSAGGAVFLTFTE